MLHIYNSLTRKKELFKPQHENKIGFYVCGPTVYDFVHMGNARSFVAFDMMVRYFQYHGYAVNYVRNITDIDDKIIKRALETHENTCEIAHRFIQAFQEDMQKLGLIKPTYEPLATDFIPQMIALIQQLISAGKAYGAENGDIYFQVREFSEYGSLSHRNIDQLESGARVEISSVKRDPLDFVLWKMAKPNEPSWDSPWGRGRPGWHTECSAMSLQLLGETFDLHGGGRDLIFPHHENEIAQSQTISGRSPVNYWVHAGYLQMNQEKMSKSLGNFFTLRELFKKYSPEVLRYFLLSSHYRSSLNYSFDALNTAHQSLMRLYNALIDLPKVSIEMKNSHAAKRFFDAMDDDFNTPIAFSVLFDLAHEIQKNRDKDKIYAAELAGILCRLGNILGLLEQNPEDFLRGELQENDIDWIESLILQRNKARSEKNWAEADRIRDELLKKNIILEDKIDGTRWKQV